MDETFDWRMVTASPIDGFLFTMGEDLKPLLAICICMDDMAGANLVALDTNLDNIFNNNK